MPPHPLEDRRVFSEFHKIVGNIIHDPHEASSAVMKVLLDNRDQVNVPEDFYKLDYDEQEKIVKDNLRTVFQGKRILFLAGRYGFHAKALSKLGAKVMLTTGYDMELSPVDKILNSFNLLGKGRLKIIPKKLEQALDSRAVKNFNPDYVFFSNICNVRRFRKHPLYHLNKLNSDRSFINMHWNTMLDKILAASPNGSVYFDPAGKRGTPVWTPNELANRFSGRISFWKPQPAPEEDQFFPDSLMGTIVAIHPHGRLPPYARIIE